MLSRSPLPTLIVLLACTLLAALLPFLTAGLSASHDPMVNAQVQLTGHAEIPGTDRETSVHQHDEGSIGEGKRGHQHEAPAIDHLHEPLFVPPETAPILCTVTRQWSPCDAVVGASVHADALERPPKLIAA